MSTISNNAPVITALLLSLLAVPAIAHESEEAHPHEAAITSPSTTSSQALAQLQEGIKIIDTLAAESKEGIHDEIEKLEKGPIASLAADTSIAHDKKDRLTASLNQLKAQLGKVHDAADKKDVAATNVELKKAHGALKMIEAILK